MGRQDPELVLDLLLHFILPLQQRRRVFSRCLLSFVSVSLEEMRVGLGY